MSAARPAPAMGARAWLRDRVEPAVLPAAAVSIVVALGFGLIVPVLPLYARSFGVAAAQVGLLGAAFALVRLFCDVPAGRLVGRVGPARSVALGTAIVAVSSAAAGLATSFMALVVLRGAGGIGSALFSAGLMAYLLTVVPRERMGRAMGLYQTSFLLGSAFGPVVGGLTAGQLGLRGPFFVYAAFCVAATLVALVTLRGVTLDQRGRPDAQAPGGTFVASGTASARGARRLHFAGLPPTRGLLAALCSAFALWWLMGGFRFLVVPLFAEERLGLDVAAISFGITVSAVANLCTTWPAGWAVDRFGRHAVGVPAFLGVALAAGAMLLARDLPGYLAANALLGACYGVAAVVPGTLLADAIPRERAGEASGYNYLAQDLGNVLGPVAIGWLLDAAGYGSAVALAAAPAVMAAGAIAAARRPRSAV
jgi:MFS transporter, DHA1 family, multidrug resistance protein